MSAKRTQDDGDQLPCPYGCGHALRDLFECTPGPYACDGCKRPYIVEVETVTRWTAIPMPEGPPC